MTTRFNNSLNRSRNGIMIEKGMRIRLHSFESAYIPSKPEGILAEYNGSWWGIYFDPNVRFINVSSQSHSPDRLVPPQPYYGFTAGCLEVLFLYCHCGNPISKIDDYLCIDCRRELEDNDSGS